MENGIEPKRTISLTWDDPGKNTRKDGKRNPAAKEDLCFIRISLGPKDPKGKN